MTACALPWKAYFAGGAMMITDAGNIGVGQTESVENS
jgi:hypothetical protein